MALAPYDTSAGGPSQGAQLTQMLAGDTMQTTFDRGQKNDMLRRSNTQETMFDKPQLESSMGATGQYNSGAARLAESKQGFDFMNQRADISSAFARSQMEMKRNEIFAGLGLIL